MDENRPYKPSWVNRVLDWINALPFHPILFHILFYLICVLLVHASLWVDGSTPPGQWVSPVFFDMIWIPFGLGYLHFWGSVAADSIEEFRTALHVPQKEFEAIKYRFLVMPFWPVLLLSSAGLALGIALLYGTHSLAATNLSKATWTLLSGPGYTFLPIWLYAAWRHVSQIGHLYGRVGLPLQLLAQHRDAHIVLGTQFLQNAGGRLGFGPCRYRWPSI